jgi:hypothetical protein
MNHTAPDASAGQDFSCQVCSQVVRIPEAEPSRSTPPALADPPRSPRPDSRDPRDRGDRRSPPVLSNDRDVDRDPRDRDWDDRDRNYRDRDYPDRDDRDYRDRRPYRDDYRRHFKPRRNFTESAVLCLVMYWLLWPVGAVLNFVYLSEVRTVERETGKQPEGRGCLLALLIVCFWVPLALLVLSIGGCIVLTAVSPSGSGPFATGVQRGSTGTPQTKSISRPGSLGRLPVSIRFVSGKAIITNTSRRSLNLNIHVQTTRGPFDQRDFLKTLDPSSSLELDDQGIWIFESWEKMTLKNDDYDTLEVDVP